MKRLEADLVGNRAQLNAAITLGLPVEPFTHTATLLRKRRGVYHPQSLWGTGTLCGRPVENYTAHNVPASQLVQICSSCGRDFATIWGQPLALYATLLEHLDRVRTRIEEAEAALEDGVCSPNRIRDLRHLRRELGDPGDLRSGSVIKNLPVLGDSDFSAEVDVLVDAWLDRIDKVIAAASVQSRAGVLAALTKWARIKAAAAKVAAGPGDPELPRRYHWCAQTVIEIWQTLRADRSDPVSPGMVSQRWASSTGRPFEELDGSTYVSDLLHRARFEGSDFTSPLEWLRAEHAAFVHEMLDATVSRLEQHLAELEADRSEAVLFVGNVNQVISDDIFVVTPPLATATGSSAAAYRFPHIVAELLARDIRRGCYASGTDLDDELVRLAVGLYDPEPGSDLSSWEKVLATTKAISA